MKLHALLLALAFAFPAQASSCCEHEEKAAESTGAGSIHQLDADWTDQHGKAVKLADFKGRTVLLTMGYATCKFACPRLAADLIAIERQLTAGERAKLDILFVSIDPARDTPARLKSFLEPYQVDPTRWHGLRGDEEGVLELSVALGIRYRKVNADDFAHSNVLAVISPTGEIVHRLEGLGADPAALLAALRPLLAGGGENSAP